MGSSKCYGICPVNKLAKGAFAFNARAFFFVVVKSITLFISTYSLIERETGEC